VGCQHQPDLPASTLVQPIVGPLHDTRPFPGIAALPGTQNPYAYALNDPVNLTDPSGKLVPFLILGMLLGGGFAAFNYWQTQPCSTFSSLLSDPGFQQAVLIGAAAGLAAGLVGARRGRLRGGSLRRRDMGGG